MIDHPGSLYSYVYADQTPDFPLPFTYPPFAAVVFYPLHLLPFGLVAFCWTVGTMAALYGVVRISQRLLGVAAGEGHRLAMLWTGIAIWLEPLRSTFDYGQINVVLALATLGAVFSSRWWLSGPAAGDGGGGEVDARDRRTLFRRRPPVGRRRRFPRSSSSPPIAVSALVVGDQTRYYFTELIFKTDRIGPICTIFNQSWRGGDLPDLRPRCRLQPGGADRNRRHRNTFRAGLACDERPPVSRTGSAGCWWSSCSGCCSPRFPGPTTGCGWCR